MFKGKKLLITGETGYFGNCIVELFLTETEIEEIRILSRDEMKQDVMRKKFNNDKLKFYIGDVVSEFLICLDKFEMRAFSSF